MILVDSVPLHLGASRFPVRFKKLGKKRRTASAEIAILFRYKAVQIAKQKFRPGRFGAAVERAGENDAAPRAFRSAERRQGA